MFTSASLLVHLRRQYGQLSLMTQLCLCSRLIRPYCQLYCLSVCPVRAPSLKTKKWGEPMVLWKFFRSGLLEPKC